MKLNKKFFSGMSIVLMLSMVLSLSLFDAKASANKFDEAWEINIGYLNNGNNEPIKIAKGEEHWYKFSVPSDTVFSKVRLVVSKEVDSAVVFCEVESEDRSKMSSTSSSDKNGKTFSIVDSYEKYKFVKGKIYYFKLYIKDSEKNGYYYLSLTSDEMNVEATPTPAPGSTTPPTPTPRSTTPPTPTPGSTTPPSQAGDEKPSAKLTVNIKNKSTIKQSKRVVVKSDVGIKIILINGKSIKIKSGTRGVTFKISKYKKKLKKKGKWNKLEVIDNNAKSKSVRFKIKR